MKGIIVNYRGGKRTQKTNQVVITPESSETKVDAEKLVGKKVEWVTPSGKKLSGQVTRVHGANGAVVARFDTGVPGQALGTNAEII